MRISNEGQPVYRGSKNDKPAAIQELTRHVVVEPDHRGVSKMLRHLAEFKKSHGDFADVELDCHKEFWDAVRLGTFDDVAGGWRISLTAGPVRAPAAGKGHQPDP